MMNDNLVVATLVLALAAGCKQSTESAIADDAFMAAASAMPGIRKEQCQDEDDLDLISYSQSATLALLDCEHCVGADGKSFVVPVKQHCNEFHCDDNSANRPSFMEFDEDYVIEAGARKCSAAFVGPDTIITRSSGLTPSSPPRTASPPPKRSINGEPSSSWTRAWTHPGRSATTTPS